MNLHRQREIFTQAMCYASESDQPTEFLERWLEGDWEVLRREWPDYAIPAELTEAPRHFADWVRSDKRIEIYAYQYDLDGPGSIAMQPVQGVPPIVIEPREVEDFLAIVAKDEPLERLLLDSCQDDLVESSDNPEVLLSAEVPLYELRICTFYSRRAASRSEEALMRRLHEESAAWRRHEADLVQIIAYA